MNGICGLLCIHIYLYHHNICISRFLGRRNNYAILL